MLSVTGFDAKGNISKVGVHSDATFGHTGCSSIAKYRFSTKELFDHHSKSKKEMLKNSFEKGKACARGSVRKIDDYACEDVCVKVENGKSVKKCPPGGTLPSAQKNTLREPFYCAIQVTANNRLWSPQAYGQTGKYNSLNNKHSMNRGQFS